MPQFLQNIDIGTVLLLAVGCIGLFVVVLLLFFGLQVLGTTLSVFSGVLHLFEGVINGGPGVWCGCLVLLFICGGCAGLALVVTTCQSNPSAINFCLLLPK
jgi:hypothetical protein